MIYYYNIFLTIFGWRYIPRKKESYLNNTFLILIACHNEEEVIWNNLQAIYNNNYNKELYQVCVIVDNCSDSTKQVCESFGDTHEGFNLNIIEVKGGSKPKALNLGISYLKEVGQWNKDYVLILDADNKISPSLLSSFNDYHEGFNILQCRIQSDNDNSFVAQGFTSSFNTMAHGFQIARNNVNLSASLSGTGFSVRREVFDEVGFEKCTSLTEDLEFSVLAIMKGYKIKYVHEEYVLNQNLDELKPSIIQRIRWCRGHMQVGVKLSSQLIKSLIKRPRWQTLDTLLFINSPSKTIIFFLFSLMTLVLFLQGNYAISLVNLLIILYNLLFVLHCNNYKIKYILPHINFALWMYFIIIYGGMTYKKKKWVKTKHISTEKK